VAVEAAPEGPWETADALVALIDGAHVAQTVGRVVVLYRPFPEKPEIKLV
jgi:RNA-binding protein YhbY